MKHTIRIMACALAAALTSGQAFADNDHAKGNAHGMPAAAMHGDNGRHLGRYKHLRTGSLSNAQIAYALGHESAGIARLRSMRSIDYNRIRIVRVSPALRARLRISALPGTAVAYEPFLASDGTVAQIFGNGGSSLLQQLQSIFAGMMINNAINNATGGGGGGATATLAQVLLNSGIPISDLLGVFFSNDGTLNALVG